MVGRKLLIRSITFTISMANPNVNTLMDKIDADAKRKRIKSRFTRYGLAAVVGAFSFGTLVDVTDYFFLSRIVTKNYEEEIARLNAEQKGLISKRDELRIQLEKKLLPIIGKNPFEEFARSVGFSPNALFDKKVAANFGKFMKWQIKFHSESKKRFPEYYKKLQAANRNYAKRCGPRISMIDHEKSVQRVGKYVSGRGRNLTRTRPVFYGLGAMVGTGLYGASRLTGGKKKKKGPSPGRRGNR